MLTCCLLRCVGGMVQSLLNGKAKPDGSVAAAYPQEKQSIIQNMLGEGIVCHFI